MKATRRHRSRDAATHLAAYLTTLVLVIFASRRATQSQEAIGIAPPALNLVNDLVLEARTGSHVFLDSDSGHNYGFFSGWFPAEAVSRIHLNTACVYDSASTTGCTTDPNRIDANRGTVVAIGFDAQPPGTFAGINLEEPENYGVNPRGIGYDLRGATRVCFNAVAPASNPAGFQVQFLVALHPTPFVSVPVQWTEMCFDFTFLGLSDEDLSNVHFLFTVVTNDVHAGAGGRVLLDRIRFEPAPTAQQTVLGEPAVGRDAGCRCAAGPCQNPARSGTCESDHDV